MIKNDVKLVSEKGDKFIVGRSICDNGVLSTIINATATDGTEVDIVLDQKDANRLLRLIAKACTITTRDLDDLYVAFERRYNPYPVQMSREEAFRRALNDELIGEDTYALARGYYGKLWHYVGD